MSTFEALILGCGVVAMIAAYDTRKWYLGIAAGIVMLFVLTRTAN